MVAGTAADDSGYFSLEVDHDNSYYLTISALWYETEMLTERISSGSVNMLPAIPGGSKSISHLLDLSLAYISFGWVKTILINQ